MPRRERVERSDTVAAVDEQMIGPDLVLGTQTEKGESVLTLRGELDAYSAPAVEEQITALMGTGARVVLELSETSFLDSSGLRAILTANRRLAGEQGTLVLRAPSEPVVRLLEITGLTEHFVIEP